MSLKDGLVQDIKKVVGESNVLTDVEDVHVYSFEQFFRKKRYPKLDLVVRVSDKDQIGRILELTRGAGVHVFIRSATDDLRGTQARSSLTVLVDDAAQPELNEQVVMRSKNALGAGREENVHRTSLGAIPNFSLALKSLFSDLPAQKCLACQVCTGYCTVSSSFNGVETWSSKGKTILTKALTSHDLQPSRKLTDVIHTCSLCGLCFADCFESTQVRKAIMQARRRLAESGFTKDQFSATVKNISEVGDPSGMSPKKRVVWTNDLLQEGTLPVEADMLFWAGCVVSTRTPNTAKAMSNLLTRAKVDFTYLGEKEGCCGYVLLAAGLWSEARENALHLVERVKETRATTVVTPCAGCYYTFTKLYPEILNIKMPARIQHATQYLESIINEGRICLHGLNWRVTYHDPCSLGRHASVYQPPRNVLKAIPSLDLVEMSLNRSRCRCCGAGGGLWSYNNAVAMNSASEKLVKDVIPLNVSGLVTACPTCQINLRYASLKKSAGVKVFDVAEVVEASVSTGS